MINLKNKKAIITGATGGIGYSIIENFYNQGAKIIGTGTNDKKLEMLKKNHLPTTKTRLIRVITINIYIYKALLVIEPRRNPARPNPTKRLTP